MNRRDILDHYRARIAYNINKQLSHMDNPSLQQLINHTGADINYVTALHIKSNKYHNPSLFTLIEISRMLDCNILDLFQEHPNEALPNIS